jgi:DNA-binding ferritin-like protein
MSELRKNTIEFLSILDGYHQICKGLHWGAVKHAEHILTDEIDGSVLEYQDKIAEIVMGMIISDNGEKFKVGELKSLTSNAKDCMSMLKEMEDDVIEYKGQIGDEAKMQAIHNVLDDMLSDINKWKYLSTFA